MVAFASHNCICKSDKEDIIVTMIEQHSNCVPHDELQNIRGHDTDTYNVSPGTSNEMKRIWNNIATSIYNARRLVWLVGIGSQDEEEIDEDDDETDEQDDEIDEEAKDGKDDSDDEDEPSISAPKPINATTEFVDDTDFASDIPTDGPATVEMVNATKRYFAEDRPCQVSRTLIDSEESSLRRWLLKKMLPAGNEMVEKTYQAKKVMKLMGSRYKKIHIQSILEDLRWHATRRITDGVLRHPADSQTWCTINEKYLEIAEDLRNLRLGISVDGVDVNRENKHHNVWPILTVIYNLPPWLCKKRKFIMLSVLISGYPGNDIDVFLESLVDDLHTLLKTGVDTYDASIKDNFNLRAIVLWTINDYPAFGTLCGCPYSRFKGVKPELFAMQEEDKTTLPLAGYTLTNAEKDIFCEMLYNIRVPQGYCSNFSSLVSLKDRKLIGLKSHDYHMLMQDVLPIAIRSIMHPPTRYAIIRFCFFYKSICSKEIILQELDKMQAELLVLCLLEKFFPLLFFDIMVHLTVHQTREVERELAISKESVSEIVRWITYGPRTTVVKHDAYNINGYTFRTKCHDAKVYQTMGFVLRQ
ncbi:hypothetical protein Tco_0635000 [Tanacetum coccineum]